TRVHACTAANALKRISEIRTPKLSRSAVVDEDNVKLAARCRTMKMRSVRGDALACCASRQQAKEYRKMFGPRNNLFNAHAGDMYGCKVHAHVGITLVGAHYKSASLSNGEIHSRQGSVGLKEFFAEMPPCRFRKLLWIVFSCAGADLLVKDIANLFLLEVNGRHHDVAWRLSQKLHDAFAQVSIYYLDTILFEERIKVAFFCSNRFALDQAPYPMRVQNVQDMTVVLFGVDGPQYLNTIRGCRLLKMCQVSIEVGQNVILYCR